MEELLHNNSLFANQDLIPLSFVQTPLGEYFVLDFVNTEHGHKKNKTDLKEALGFYGGTYVSPHMVGKKPKGFHIFEVLKTLDNVLIEKDRDFFTEISFEETYLCDLFDEDIINKHASEKFEQRMSDFKEKKYFNLTEEPTFDDVKLKYLSSLSQVIWDQLIRRSAKDTLAMSHHSPPGFVTHYDNGFVISDGGELNNCGYGQSQLFMCKFVEQNDVLEQDFVFPYKTYTVNKPVEGFKKYLSGGDLARLSCGDLELAEGSVVVENAGNPYVFMFKDK